MRPHDIARLSSSIAHEREADSETLMALGLALPNFDQLTEAIFGDLQDSPPFGISWWDPTLAPEFRILVSDQLYVCTKSVFDNLIESSLHWLEFIDWKGHDDNLIPVKVENGRLYPGAPRRDTPLQVLTPWMKNLHTVGIIRALASALDCLSGTIVGVIGLPTNILRADFKRVRNQLIAVQNCEDLDRTKDKEIQACFSSIVDTLIDQHGPSGWVEWMLDYRNMLVHRGRRIGIGQIFPSEVLGPDGLPARAFRHSYLPLDPARSDVEVLCDDDRIVGSLLTEDAGTTLEGLITSTSGLVDSIATELYEIWTWRRQNPTAIVQPNSQWGRTSESTNFVGYSPGESQVDISKSTARTHPEIRRRLCAAALDDENRHRWKRFRAE